jgi:hypothetical protein
VQILEPAQGTPVVYCLTRDRQLATDLDGRLVGALAFFYNDAARLNQAVQLRLPTLVLLDTDAIRPEFGDGGLGPVLAWLRQRAPSTRLAVRPALGAERLVASEAGGGVTLLPHDRGACVDAVAAFCGCP